MQKQSISILLDVSCSLISSVLFWIERTFAGNIDGSGVLDGLAFDLARTPVRLPLFCFLSQRLLLRPPAVAGNGVCPGDLPISRGINISAGN